MRPSTTQVDRHDLIDSLRQLMPRSAAEELVRGFEHAQAERQRQWLLDDGYLPDCVCGGCGYCIATEFINRIDPDNEEYRRWDRTK